MTQKRFHNWLDDDSTFALNQKFYGILRHGRYVGFAPSGGLPNNLTLGLVHTGDNFKHVGVNGIEGAALGIWVSRQGVVITEDDAIVLTIGTNASQLARIDLIVGEHAYQETTGGAAAIYSVIQGTPGVNPVAPALTFPNKQVILGYLHIPANATNLSTCTYKPADIPQFAGDANLMYQQLNQVVTGQKEFNTVINTVGTGISHNATDESLVVTEYRNVYILPETDANTYLNVKDIDVPTTTGRFKDGHSFKVWTRQKLRIKAEKSSVSFPADTSLIHSYEADLYVDPGQVLEFLEVSDYAMSNMVGPPTRAWVLVVHEGVGGKRFHHRELTVQRKAPAAADISTNPAVNLDDPDIAGNYIDVYHIGGAGATRDLKYVSSAVKAGFEADSSAGGCRIILRNSGDRPVKLWHLAGAVPGGFKPIRIPTVQDEILEIGGMIEIVEDTSWWRVVNAVGERMNSFGFMRKGFHKLIDTGDCSQITSTVFTHSLEENCVGLTLTASGMPGAYFVLLRLEPFTGIPHGYEVMLRFLENTGLQKGTVSGSQCNIAYINDDTDTYYGAGTFQEYPIPAFARNPGNYILSGSGTFYARPNLYSVIKWDSSRNLWIEVYRSGQDQ